MRADERLYVREAGESKIHQWQERHALCCCCIIAGNTSHCFCAIRGGFIAEADQLKA